MDFHKQLFSCQFHVIKYLYKKVSDCDVTKANREELRKKLGNLVYASTATEYDKLKDKITSLANDDFGEYFKSNWENCRPMWVSYLRDQYLHLGNTTNNRLETHHQKLKDLISRSSMQSEMFEQVLSFSSTLSFEYSQKSFLEEFTSCSTAFDDISCADEIVGACTEYVTNLVCEQLRLANTVRYEIKQDSDDEYKFELCCKDQKHIVFINSNSCSCVFATTIGLPCRHLFATRNSQGLSAFSTSMVRERWLKSYQIQVHVHTEKDHPQLSDQMSYDMQVLSTTQFSASQIKKQLLKSTLSRNQNYTKALGIGQKIAGILSQVGMRRFREMFSVFEDLLGYWEHDLLVAVIPQEDKCSVEQSACGQDSGDKVENVESSSFVETITLNPPHPANPSAPLNGDFDIGSDPSEVCASSAKLASSSNGTFLPCSIDLEISSQLSSSSIPHAFLNTAAPQSGSVDELVKITPNPSNESDSLSLCLRSPPQATNTVLQLKKLWDNIKIKPKMKIKDRPEHSCKLWPLKNRKSNKENNPPGQNKLKQAGKRVMDSSDTSTIPREKCKVEIEATQISREEAGTTRDVKSHKIEGSAEGVDTEVNRLHKNGSRKRIHTQGTPAHRAKLLRRAKEKTTKLSEVIIVEDENVPAEVVKKSAKRACINHDVLGAVDFKILHSPCSWLNDKLINVGMALLKLTYPKVRGFQRCNLLETLNFQPESGEFVQILNCSRNHWICISTYGCPPSKINVYDSLRTSDIPSSTKEAVAAITSTHKISLL